MLFADLVWQSQTLRGRAQAGTVSAAGAQGDCGAWSRADGGKGRRRWKAPSRADRKGGRAGGRTDWRVDGPWTRKRCWKTSSRADRRDGRAGGMSRQLRSSDDYPSWPGGRRGGTSLRSPINDDDEEIDYSRRNDPDVFNRRMNNLGDQALPTCPIMLGFVVSWFSLYLLSQSQHGGGFGPAKWTCGGNSTGHNSTGYLDVEWEDGGAADGSAAGPEPGGNAHEAQALLHIISWSTACFVLPTWLYVLMWVMDRCCGDGRTCKEECCEYLVGGLTCLALPVLVAYEFLLIDMAFKVFGGQAEHCEMEGGARPAFHSVHDTVSCCC